MWVGVLETNVELEVESRESVRERIFPRKLKKFLVGSERWQRR